MHADLTKRVSDLGVEYLNDIPIEDLLEYLQNVCEDVSSDARNTKDADEKCFLMAYGRAAAYIKLARETIQGSQHHIINRKR